MRLIIVVILSAGTLKGEICHTWPQFTINCRDHWRFAEFILPRDLPIREIE